MDDISKSKMCVELKEQGMFYRAVNDSARVICALMGYKPQLRKTGKIECGFPKTSLEKVEGTLISAQIDYRIWNKNLSKNNGLECISENHFNENNFEKYIERFGTCVKQSNDNNVPYSNQASINNLIAIGKEKNQQICEYVQGQGLTMESAMMDFQRRIQDMYINQGLLIDNVSFVSNQTGSNALFLIQGLIIYRK